MSVIIDEHGKICVAHVVDYDGMPVGLSYSPGRKSLTLHLDNGMQKQIGHASAPSVVRSLHRSTHIKFLQIRGANAAQHMDIPLQLHLVE